jgi:DNA-binding MarR family transcriptional regulator
VSDTADTISRTGQTLATPGRDLMSLARAGMAELLDALQEQRTIEDDGTSLPPRSVQIAGLILAHAIRLIRLGTREELLDGGLELAETLTRPTIRDLDRRQPEALRLLSGASVALKAAAAPSSAGGELAVLRSWNGNAREAVATLNASPSLKLARAELRERLGVNQSYLSHLLADLEGAGLVVRTRDGRDITVHLGPAARAERVQVLLPEREPVVEGVRGSGSRLRELVLDFAQFDTDRMPPLCDAAEIAAQFQNYESTSPRWRDTTHERVPPVRTEGFVSVLAAPELTRKLANAKE